jgi:eukaryotic-like serine/threonine-protein kinase
MATETQRPAAIAPIEGLSPGVRLGRYELLRQLATGGMAVVWIARQIGQFGFTRNVALKTIRPEHAADIAFRKMFLDEARLASRIRHANVAEVLDLGEEGQVVYQAIELVEGTSLKRLIEAWRARSGGGLPVPIAARVMVDALRGLHAAHELRDDQGVPLLLVHRDVSPHNILVGIDGLAKISDFGIAKAFGRIADETDAGAVKGKYAYMSPEQLRRSPLDRRSDVFAAGIVLWEALTGERLFAGGDVLETAERVLTQPIDDLHERSVPKLLASVVAKALCRAPEERHASAEDMADAIEGAVRLATGKELASFADDLVRDDVSVFRNTLEAARAARAATTLAEATPLPDPEQSIVQRRSPPRRWPLALVPFALVVVVASVAATRSRKESGVVTAIEQAPASASPSASPPPAAESSLLPLVQSSSSSPSSSPPIASFHPPNVHRSAPPRATQRPRSPAPPPSHGAPERDPRWSSPY